MEDFRKALWEELPETNRELLRRPDRPFGPELLPALFRFPDDEAKAVDEALATQDSRSRPDHLTERRVVLARRLTERALTAYLRHLDTPVPLGYGTWCASLELDRIEQNWRPRPGKVGGCVLAQAKEEERWGRYENHSTERAKQLRRLAGAARNFLTQSGLEEMDPDHRELQGQRPEEVEILGRYLLTQQTNPRLEDLAEVLRTLPPPESSPANLATSVLRYLATAAEEAAAQVDRQRPGRGNPGSLEKGFLEHFERIWAWTHGSHPPRPTTRKGSQYVSPFLGWVELATSPLAKTGLRPLDAGDVDNFLRARPAGLMGSRN